MTAVKSFFLLLHDAHADENIFVVKSYQQDSYKNVNK